MARAKKTDIYKEIYSDLSIDEMKALKTELEYAIKDQLREAARKAKKEEAKKLRDTLKIHDRVKFLVKKEAQEGEVVTISVDKVQVQLKDGSRKTVAYQKLLK